ncbi:hypothetical protein [Thermoanaerobacterium sp. RBIITD]|uniref:hypothetical protein n=1 Tax=Thermoanaerobacterium sp. RBIITD TaxID=1550240 RepID=UPI001E4A87D0|nr:hypothetical protein [Thermoanaerobacterium sp. RBIITD]
MKYKILLLFILITCFLILLFFKQIQAISLVIYEGHSIKITSLHFNNIGRPLTVVNAIDNKGNRNIYFINQIHFFNPHLEYTVNSKDGISREKAISIVNNNKLCDEILKIELKHETTENPRKELVYWEVL